MKKNFCCIDPMKIDSFDITFDEDNSEGVYFAGEKVKGRAVLTLTEEAKINEFLLELKGGSKTHWTKHAGKSAAKHFRDSENYFCEQFNTKYTWAYGRENDRILPKGSHVTHFQLALSDNLPSSFEGEYGYIRYTVKATLERPWDSDILCKRAFTVIGTDSHSRDFTDRRDVTNDCEDADRKSATISLENCPQFACCPCRRKSVNTAISIVFVSSTILVPIFVPGEKLFDERRNRKLRLKIQQSGKGEKSVILKKSIKLSVVQSVEYSAKNFDAYAESRTQTRTLLKKEIKNLRIEPQADGTDLDCFSDVILPPVVSNSNSNCRIIKFAYELRIDVEGRSIFTTPIMVGVVVPTDFPKKENVSNNDTAVDNEETGRKSVTFLLDDRTPVAPSGGQMREIFTRSRAEFRDDIFGEVDIGDEKIVQFCHSKFAPKYPYYHL